MARWSHIMLSTAAWKPSSSKETFLGLQGKLTTDYKGVFYKISHAINTDRAEQGLYSSVMDYGAANTSLMTGEGIPAPGTVPVTVLHKAREAPHFLGKGCSGQRSARCSRTDSPCPHRFSSINETLHWEGDWGGTGKILHSEGVLKKIVHKNQSWIHRPG